MRRDKAGQPVNLDGRWQQIDNEDGYARYIAGPVEVRYHPAYEPDGELVSALAHGGKRVSVHAERMDKGAWSIILTDEDGNDIHIDLWSKSRIHVMWREELAVQRPVVTTWFTANASSGRSA